MKSTLSERLPDAKRKSRWHQYITWTILVLVIVACSWIGAELHRIHQRLEEIDQWRQMVDQRQAVARIRELGGSVTYRPNSDIIYAVDLSFSKVSDLTFLTRLIDVERSLESLSLNSTKVRDLSPVTQWDDLSHLDISNTPVSDADLQVLPGATNLSDLRLNATQVSDAGIKHLAGMTQLRYLHLVDTQVTDEGIEELQQALPNCTVFRN